jgi:ribosome maturation factor RimP
MAERVAKSALQDRLTAVAEKVAEYYGVEVVELTHFPGKHQTVRLLLDKKGGITIDEIAAVSRRFSADLDIDDVVPGRYTLEVSSPGLDRPLKTQADFRRKVGESVTLKFRDDEGKRKSAKGIIAHVNDTTVTIGTTEYEWDRVIEAKVII